jgi:hypothetical protein
MDIYYLKILRITTWENVLRQLVCLGIETDIIPKTFLRFFGPERTIERCLNLEELSEYPSNLKTVRGNEKPIIIDKLITNGHRNTVI